MRTTTDYQQWLKLAVALREQDAAKAEPRPIIDGLNKPDPWRPTRPSGNS